MSLWTSGMIELRVFHSRFSAIVCAFMRQSSYSCFVKQDWAGSPFVLLNLTANLGAPSFAPLRRVGFTDIHSNCLSNPKLQRITLHKPTMEWTHLKSQGDRAKKFAPQKAAITRSPREPGLTSTLPKFRQRKSSHPASYT